MNFLAMTPLQAALLGAVTAMAVIAMYLLKLRHRRVVVSSSILWTRVLDERHAHSLWERLRKFISILIAVTIALLLALALARPQITWLTGSDEGVVIVLDTSATMATRMSDGRTRWQHAVDEARALLNSGGATTEFRVLDTAGRAAFSPTTNRNEASDMIGQLRPQAGAARFPEVTEQGSTVYFISDGVSISEAPAAVKRISVFEEANNVGITAFDIRSIPSTPLGYEAYLEVQNFGPRSEAVGITLTAGTGQTIAKSVSLASGETLQDVFDLSRFEGGAIRASIVSDDDDMAADDLAFGYLPVKRRTRTLLVTRGNNYLESLLKLDSHVELLKTDPAGYGENPDIDVYIFDRFAPAKAPARPALVIGAPAGATGAAWLREARGVVQKPEITTWAEDHPIMQYVSVHDLSIERAARIDASNLTVIAASNQTPLIVASENPKWVMLTFDLQSSDFPLQLGFPVFVENVLSWFGREQLAVHQAIGTVEVPMKDAQIQTAEGTAVDSQTVAGRTIFEAPEPGLYSATSGDTRIQIAVNLGNKAFSNVNSSVFTDERAAVSAPNWLRRELWFYMLFAAILLISVEWFTYHRRVTL